MHKYYTVLRIQLTGRVSGSCENLEAKAVGTQRAAAKRLMRLLGRPNTLHVLVFDTDPGTFGRMNTLIEHRPSEDFAWLTSEKDSDAGSASKDGRHEARVDNMRRLCKYPRLDYSQMTLLLKVCSPHRSEATASRASDHARAHWLQDHNQVDCNH